jgi:hypothetical protein
MDHAWKALCCVGLVAVAIVGTAVAIGPPPAATLVETVPVFGIFGDLAAFFEQLVELLNQLERFFEEGTEMEN